MFLYCLYIVLYTPCLIAYYRMSEGPEEYCTREIFHGRCDDGEVIEMKSAKFGRMHVGKCVKKDVGKYH